MINFTIYYTKYETLMRIDIEYRPEQTIIPAFTIGFFANDEMLHFGQNASEFSANDTKNLINEILYENRNHTRKTLSIDRHHQSLRKCFNLSISDQILDSTSISKSFDLYIYRKRKFEFDPELASFFSTFHLSLNSPQFRTEKKSNEIFSILFNDSNCEEIYNEKSFFLFMHSTLFQYFINMSEFLEISRKVYFPSYKLRGTKRIYIENRKQSCSYYDSDDRPFDAISQSICLRKCYQKYCQNKFRCNPLIIKSIISSLDEENNELKFCSRELNDLCDKDINTENIMSHCMKYCPKDCIDLKVKQSNCLEFDNELYRSYDGEIIRDIRNDLIEVNVIWDKKYPLISYIETPVMSFTEYLCYCGGLIGLWFGTNAYQIISYVMDSRNWISLKNKLQTFGRILIAMIWGKINIFLNFVSNFRIRLNIDIE